MAMDAHKLKHSFRIIRKAFREYKWRFIWILILGFITGIFGGLGIGAVVPIFSIITNKGNVQTDKISLIIQKVFSIFHIPYNLSFLVFFIAVLFVLKGLVQFSAKYLNHRTAAEYEEALRNDLFKITLKASWPYILEQKTGYLERIIMNDVYSSSVVIIRSATFILLATSLSMYALVAMTISPTITLLTLAFGAVIFWIFKPFFKKIKRISHKMAATEKVVAHRVSESMFGAKIIKALSIEEEIGQDGHQHFAQLKKDRVKSAFYLYSIENIYEPLGFMFVALVFIYYYRLPSFNLIAFAAVVYLVQKMFAYVQSLQGIVYEIGQSIPYLQTVIDYRRLSNENKEGVGGSVKFSLHNRLEFKNIAFSYRPETEVLSGVTFDMKKGEMIGLVGSSGSGKTTIADLLLRLFYPNSGEILLDGKNVNEIDIKSWRKHVGYVSQDMFLLNDTVENNVRFFDSSLSDEDIREAIKTAEMLDFVEELPEGLNTIIGERGIKLSVGQRQRIILARALAKKPQILILDEATSSLDNKSEGLIRKAIEDLHGKVTVLAIAHRLSTIMNSDHLIILDGGKIIEEGQPSKLLENKDSHFYKMYNIDHDN